MSRRRVRSRLTVLAASGILLGLVASGAHAVPVSAAGEVAGGRLVVMWRTASHPAVGLSSAAAELRGPNHRRSVVIARPGQSRALAAQLRADPDVLAVVPDAIVTADGWPTTAPNDPYYAGKQADLGVMEVPAAWQTTTGSSSVVVAVLDTGMYTAHPDLAGVTVVSPRNEIANTTDVTDGHGHGTHVIGEIAAATDNGLGVAGIAPGVSIMPVKVLSDGGTGWFSDILDGIDWARTHGATVISMSLGAQLDPSTVAAYQPVIDAAYSAGITIVAAAGNNGDGTISYPAAFNHVLSIAATDNNDQRAWFSNANATVDLAAPGVGITSTYKDGGYVSMTGTSMSTPHVAAVAALIRSAHPGETVDQVEHALRSTAVDLGTAGRDDAFGSGRVDAAAAVAWTPDAAPPPPPSAITVLTPAAGAAMTASTATSVAWAESGGPFVARSIQRQRATAADGACGAFSANGPAIAVSGSPVSQATPSGFCYRWVVEAATDRSTVTATSGSILVDAAAPTTSATVSGPTGLGGWKTGPATVTLTSAAPSGASVAYRVDGAASTTYRGPFTIAGNGQHTLTFRATGGTDISSTSATTVVKVDGAAPSATIASVAATARAHRYAISVSASDGVSGIATKRLYYSPAGGPFRVYGTIGPDTKAFIFVAPSAGTYRLYVRSMDAAGNVSRAPGTTGMWRLVVRR